VAEIGFFNSGHDDRARMDAYCEMNELLLNSFNPLYSGVHCNRHGSLQTGF
jgi:hypothetical protein